MYHIKLITTLQSTITRSLTLYADLPDLQFATAQARLVAFSWPVSINEADHETRGCAQVLPHTYIQPITTYTAQTM